MRLRVEDGLSLDEITTRLEVPRGTCAGWIRGLKLDAAALKARRSATAVAVNQARPKKERGSRSALDTIAEGEDYTPNEIGAIAEAATTLRLLIKRWKVLNSGVDGDIVDLYATRPAENRLLKIQVRTARSADHRLPIVSLRRMRYGKTVLFERGDFDILVGYCLYNDTAYVWTFDEVAKFKCSISVTDDAAEAWGKLDAAFAALPAARG